MSKRLFVGGLPYSLTENQLKDLFAEFGTVTSCSLIIDRYSGQSKGFGFVDLDDADADKAIETLNGKEIEGRKIVVNIARPAEDRGGRDFGNGSRGNSDRRGN